MSTCAYCGNEAQLTIEHVVPNFLYKDNPLAKFGYNFRADRFMSWEIQTKDVCAQCNNNHLSQVDTYANQFFKDNRVDRMITNEKSLRITYDYSWLSRLLLKITFNCLRFKGEKTQLLRPFADYILHGVGFPPEYHVKIAVEIVPCHKITDNEKAYLPEVSKDWEYLPPHMIRAGEVCGISDGDIFVRYIFINNFCFYCIIYPQEILPDQLRAASRRLLSACRSAVFLHRCKTAVTIRVSSTSALDRYTDTATTLVNKWTEYLNQMDTPDKRLHPIAEETGSG